MYSIKTCTLLFNIPEKMDIDNASLNIVYDLKTGKEHESIAPVLLDYDPIERINELESVMKGFIDNSNLVQINSLQMRVFLLDQSRKFKQLIEEK